MSDQPKPLRVTTECHKCGGGTGQISACVCGVAPADVLSTTEATPPAERPTPETDAWRKQDMHTLERAFQFMERLERERDNAISDWKQADTDSIRAIHERNDARELIAVKDRSINAANQTIMLNNELMRQATDKLAEVREQRDQLAAQFTKLDKPKYSGAPMMDKVLSTRNPEFDAWVQALPPTYWTRYDLSAARIGWEAAKGGLL